MESPLTSARLLDGAALAALAQLLVTIGCGEACPVVPGAERIDWELSDPMGQRARDPRSHRRALTALIEARGWAPR